MRVTVPLVEFMYLVFTRMPGKSYRTSREFMYFVCTCIFLGALRPRGRDGLLGTGTEWEGDDRVKARPGKPPEKDRRDRGPPPEQWKC